MSRSTAVLFEIENPDYYYYFIIIIIIIFIIIIIICFVDQHVMSAGPSGERIDRSLQQLRRGAVRLREQCARQPVEVTPGHPELRGHTQQVNRAEVCRWL